MSDTWQNPQELLQPRRKIQGISAILLPFLETGEVDWTSFRAHVARTAEHGLIPAVNMDTGYVNLIDHATQDAVLQATRETLGGGAFVAGAFVKDAGGAKFNADAYKERMAAITTAGGTPVIFQSFGLVEQQPAEIVTAYQTLATSCDAFLGFELTQELAAFGRIYDLETYAELMMIPQCVGAKHSSFHREPEWQRLQLRNTRRPDFVVYTGNDFAIDMVMYGSDYLLGLSTFAPDVFALRDQYWLEGNPAFYELNDILQYLGYFTFRRPGPAYKHSAAQFLHMRNWLSTRRTHPDSPTRPDSDLEVLRDIAVRLEIV